MAELMAARAKTVKNQANIGDSRFAAGGAYRLAAHPLGSGP